MDNIEKLEKNLEAAYEEINYHTDALIIKALAVSDYNSVLELAKIAQEQNEAGYLTEELNTRRNKIIQELK